MPGKVGWEDKFLSALGYLLIQANDLDEALTDLYWIVSGKTEVDVFKAVREQTLGGLIALTFKAFEARITDKDLRAELDALKTELNTALAIRNEFVHAHWVFGDGEMHHHRRPRSGRVVEKIRKMRVADVEAATDKIAAAAESVYELYDKTRERIPADAIEPRGGPVRADGTYLPGGVKKV